MLITNILLTVVLILLVFILLFFYKEKKTQNIITLSDLLSKSGIDKQIGELNTHANEIKNLHKSIEQMLKIPQDRGALGELALEKILEDQLPEELYGIRKEVFNKKIPDAHINSRAGIICIDSKFPLNNYLSFVNSDSNKDKITYKKEFIKNTKSHLQKIKDDYICIENGSAPFAFAYIPSEAVYYFLATEGIDLLREYAKVGVQVVSPITISHKIELIKADIYATKLSKDVKKIQDNLSIIKSRFNEVNSEWKTFFEGHLKNSFNKAQELNTAYKKLNEDFEQILKID